jgi:protein-L-isoaspartate(D-aspartate) O-methyltransferase
LKSLAKAPVKAVNPPGATEPRRPGFPAALGAGTTGLTSGRNSGRADAQRPSSYPASAAPALPARQPGQTRQGSPAGVPGVVGASGMLTQDFQAVRARMVQKLVQQGLSDPRVQAALGQVERHRFVDSALANQAYEDTSLPIGLGQTISKPNVVARMLELLLQGTGEPLGRVLEIGTGCGYQAVVLAQLAREVYSIERLRGLHDKARENVRPFRLTNLHLLFGDGMAGYAKGAPYAAIIAAAGGEALPQAWMDQLAVGGRLVAPMQVGGGAQALVVVDKSARGLRQTVLEAVHFVPLKSGTL